jgi:hypothetical protein
MEPKMNNSEALNLVHLIKRHFSECSPHKFFSSRIEAFCRFMLMMREAAWNTQNIILTQILVHLMNNLLLILSFQSQIFHYFKITSKKAVMLKCGTKRTNSIYFHLTQRASKEWA